jgi:hypothetical protein
MQRINISGGMSVQFDLSEFNWPLIVIIVLISAAVSYIGDSVGKKIGKKRISLLGLRPRYTSTVITIVTGVGVALATLSAAVYSSDSVKMAIFGPNIMARQMTELMNEVRTRQSELDDMTFELITAQSELSSVKDEKAEVEKAVAALREETENLKAGLAEMKEGRVIVFQGEMLAQTILEPGADGYEVDAAVETLVRLANEYLHRRIIEAWKVDAEDAPAVVVTDKMRSVLINALRAPGGRKVFRLTAPSNIVMGQTLEGTVNVFDSSLIYAKDEVLMKDPVYGWRNHGEAADILYTMLKQINGFAVAKGVLPDPYLGTVGNLDTLDFYDIVDQMVELGGGGVITILAAEDIYTEGPVRVRIEVGES